MLEIKALAVSVDNKAILKGIDLVIRPGEVHALMGPNGSGKSTLANVIAGREGYDITAGSILWEGVDITRYSPEARAQKGLFLGFQYPVEMPGVTNVYFLKAVFNALQKARGHAEVDAVDFLNIAKDQLNLLKMDEAMLYRAVNEGFSGGEKKRNEILQMLIMAPALAVLDETDSGLDIDALRIISEGIQHFRKPHNSLLLITHYQRLLNHIKPDCVHVLMDGKICQSGDYQLALTLEAKGYGWLKNL